MEATRGVGKYLGLTIGVFAIVGVGIGLTGFFPIEYTANQLTNTGGGEFAQAIGQLFVGVIFLQSVIMAMFTGPTIGGLTGLISGMSLNDRTSSIIVGGVGGLVGFYVMVIIAVVVMSLAMPSGGDGGQSAMQQSTNLSDLLGPVIKSGLPTGVVGAVTGALGGIYVQ